MGITISGIIKAASKVVLFTAGAALLGSALYPLIGGGAPSWQSAGLGIFSLLAANFDHFEMLKGFGFEAKAHKLDKKIDEASAALSRVRELAEFVGASVVDLSSRTGRWDSYISAREARDQAQLLRQVLASAGVSEEVTRRALQPWIKASVMDIAYAMAHRWSEGIRLRSVAAGEAFRAASGRTDLDPAELARLKGEVDRLSRALEDLKGFGPGVGASPGSYLVMVQGMPLEGTERDAAVRDAQELLRVAQHLQDNLDFPDGDRWLAFIAADRDR